MLNPFKKKETSPGEDSAHLTWDNQATQALDKAVNEAPVPKPLKSKVKKELKGAAEEKTRAAGRETVTAEDLMQGMLAKMPENMRSKVENAMAQGPEGLKKLEDEMKNK